MGWMEAIGEAIGYVEDHIEEPLQVEDVARAVHISPFYFQKGFSMLCGYPLAEYIRKRRLALAGSVLISGNIRIIDLALRYGYDSPDSFTKAFTRFHGVTPTAAKRDGVMLKSFAPLKIKFILEGGNLMDYKIVNKASFTLLGAAKKFRYDGANAEIPVFWQAHYASGNNKYVCGMFGVCIDLDTAGGEFEYLIADNYNPAAEIPDGFVTRTIPACTWAVFPCTGALPKALQSVTEKIYSEWLPSCREYEIAAGYSIEMYSDPNDYEGGNANAQYYTEVWVPVKKK